MQRPQTRAVAGGVRRDTRPLDVRPRDHRSHVAQGGEHAREVVPRERNQRPGVRRDVRGCAPVRSAEHDRELGHVLRRVRGRVDGQGRGIKDDAEDAGPVG